MKPRIQTLLLLLTFATVRAAAVNFLFANGKTDYSIVLPANATVSERTAAKELQHYIRQISGAVVGHASMRANSGIVGHASERANSGVVGHASMRANSGIVGHASERASTDEAATLGSVAHYDGKHIYIGWNEACGLPCPDSDDEGFTYLTVGDDLHIFGGSERGTMYGVFAFLERELGVRWYTSSFTKVPQMDSYELPQLNHSERPAIRQRLDFCYDSLRNPEWMAHNRMNTMHIKRTTNYGPFTAYWGSHTFNKLIPPEKYFDEHPEYFSLHKGQRSDKAQLCLSNDDMRHELTENLKDAIRENPGYWCYDVSQNDNDYNCECPECMKLVEWYGGRSGALLSFVNQVADDVRQEFPDIYIGTFAYRTTRQAPRTGSVTPADNVVIRLCDIECCMAHPIAECPQNSSFLDDLDAWLRLTPNIYIWDYANSFYHYLLPFPNYRALAVNFQLFANSNVIGIMEEGAHDAPWSEFSELKQWMIAQLLWNPWQDTDSLSSMFITDYYGAAAPFIQQYFELCQSRISNDRHLTLKTEPADPFFGSTFVTDGLRIVEKALAAADDEQTLQRTRRVAAQMYYMKLQRETQKATADGTLEKLCDIIVADSTILRENKYTLQRVLDSMGLRLPSTISVP